MFHIFSTVGGKVALAVFSFIVLWELHSVWIMTSTSEYITETSGDLGQMSHNLIVSRPVNLSRVRSPDSKWRISTFRSSVPLDQPQYVPPSASFGAEVFHGSSPELDHSVGVADPFLIKFRGVYWMFYELMLPKGVIAMAMSLSGTSDWVGHHIVLHPSHHISYPNVFEVDGKMYMVPSAADTHKVVLYHTECFPYEWQVLHTMIEGEPYSDPSLVYHQNMWYMFASNGLPTRNRPADSILYLFFSDTLTGKWQQHPQSPFLDRTAKDTRNAGNPFFLNNRLYRKSQDNSVIYGGSVSLHEIVELTPTSFAEKPGRPVLHRQHDWNENAAHTLSAVGDIVAVDGAGFVSPTERKQPHALIQSLQCPTEDQATPSMKKFRESEVQAQFGRSQNSRDLVLRGFGDEVNKGSGGCLSTYSWGWFFPDYVQYLSEFARFLDLSPGDTLFETTAGTGQFLDVVSLVVPGVVFAGADIAHGAPEALQRLYPDGRFCWSDSTNLMWVPDNSFDRTVSVAALSYFEDRDAYFREMLRITKPGGSVGLITGAAAFDAPQYFQRFVDSGECADVKLKFFNPEWKPWKTVWALLRKPVK
jgi:Methyltransferase domain